MFNMPSTLVSSVPTTIRNRNGGEHKSGNKPFSPSTSASVCLPPFTLFARIHAIRNAHFVLSSFFPLHRFFSKQFSTNMNTNCYIVNFLFSFISFGSVRFIFRLYWLHQADRNTYERITFSALFSFHWFFVSSFRIEDARAVGRRSTTRKKVDNCIAGNLAEKKLWREIDAEKKEEMNSTAKLSIGHRKLATKLNRMEESKVFARISQIVWRTVKCV